MNTKLLRLEQLLDYTFRDRALLLQALTHPSYLHEVSGETGDYQRLEFLGDAVLGLLLAEMLFACYPDGSEGALSQLRSRLANQDALADRARMLGLGDYILLGCGEKQSGGHDKDSILADVLEAIIAALYKDGGLQAARKLVEQLFEKIVAAPESLSLGRDSKSELQEYLSAINFLPPVYRLIEESGPPHDRLFCFHVVSGDSVIGDGRGKSKKTAQQAAASAALETLYAQQRPTE